MDLAELKEFLAYAARARSLLVAGFSWAIYDWLITLGQEIDLVWNRPGALTSKLLFAFTRYTGLGMLTPKLVVVGVPSLSIISTVGGSRLLLNVRAVYFSSIRNPSHPGHSDWLDTEGTVGRFWSPGMGGKCDNDDDGDRECAASISMGVWSNEDVQRNRPPSPEPPVIILQPVPPGRKRFFRPPPRPALFGPASEQGAAASSSGLSMGPEGDGDEVSQSRSVISVAHSTDPQASSSMIGASTQQTEDPDVEEGTPGKG
ncbi:hypothetical protein FRC05_003554 [Tulasnella sp. 425]|nr:hypothetical protein FRC05_003554 [Tulasnella sp. 425]